MGTRPDKILVGRPPHFLPELTIVNQNIKFRIVRCAVYRRDGRATLSAVLQTEARVWGQVRVQRGRCPAQWLSAGRTASEATACWRAASTTDHRSPPSPHTWSTFHHTRTHFHGAGTILPSPPVDNIRTMMIVRRMSGKIITTVLCCIVCMCTTVGYAHTHTGAVLKDDCWFRFAVLFPCCLILLSGLVSSVLHSEP